MDLKTVIDRLCDHFAVHGPQERESLISRVKQLQRMGYPAETNVGRGKRNNWSEAAYADLLIVSELRALGLPAQTALDVVAHSLTDLREAYQSKTKVEIAHSAFKHGPTKSKLLIDFTS